jgi:hypothetical protein
MYVLALLRFVFGLLPGTSAVTPSRQFRWTAVSQSGRIRATVLRGALPHDWVSVDDAWTESPRGFTYRGRGTFDKANHLLRCVLRVLRRLAGGPELCPVPAPTVSPGDSRLCRY